jgi:hypothetical protein
MATTYADFQDYVLRTLWRTGDTELTADLPQLIREAEARMSRDLRIEDNTTIAQFSMTANDEALPSDYAQMRSVEFGQYGLAAYITPQEYNKKAMGYKDQVPPFYTVMTKSLYVLGNIGATTPLDVSLLYYHKVPPYEDNATLNQFYEDYPDMYLACVLTQTYAYLRDPAASQIFGSKYGELAQSVMDNEVGRKYAGSELYMDLPGLVR